MLQCLADCLEQCDDLCRGALKLRDAVLPVLIYISLPLLAQLGLGIWPLTPLYLRFTATPIKGDARLETLVRWSL
ncbi:hypothetical protein ARSEF1564_003342 [Beauveria bassiana]